MQEIVVGETVGDPGQHLWAKAVSAGFKPSAVYDWQDSKSGATLARMQIVYNARTPRVMDSCLERESPVLSVRKWELHECAK